MRRMILVFNNLKKGFNAHVEELIGDFIKPVRPILYKFAKLIYKV
ncbi:UDP-N-acetylmuramoylheptapeptide-glycine L-seryltransferase [Staphylococcus aureus]|nr:UDP-N-acetylmuramoylheptapeptide-glycine L-seryltransferase [Staphylococcus aureus]